MRDIRLLTLYKQHYLDDYEEPLKSRISVLGYYDGIDIQKVEGKYFGNISAKRSQAPISELWYDTGKKIEEMTGGKSNQNIGLFRCMGGEESEKAVAEYWECEKRLPYFAVGFLKIREPQKYREVGLNLEAAFNVGADDAGRLCAALTYITFDNADLVILIKGNSMTRMCELMEETERREEVLYAHFIPGVEEGYLEACKDRGRVLDEWKGTSCFTGDKIARIELQMATSGDPSVWQALKEAWDKSDELYSIKGYDGIAYSHIAGHCNLYMALNDTDVKSLLVLLLPGGVITHQNGIYGRGLYNIETTLQVKENLWKKFSAEDPIDNSGNRFQDEKAGESGGKRIGRKWCQAQIQRCKAYFRTDLIRNDEGLYSYYQSLIQTLNALDQFERFHMSREIFCLLYPSFSLFCSHLEKMLQDSGTYGGRAESLKRALCAYLESVNSVIYHTIHTDQVYLMIPGYCGTSFSIPIRLQLFFLWYIREVIGLLNDNTRKFACIMTPVMESRPITEIIEMKPDGSENLISVRFSQRALFLPRDMFIICGHEMGHYVGKDLRCRERRIICILKTLIYYIVEGLFPENYEDPALTGLQQKVFQLLKTDLRNGLQRTVKGILIEAKAKRFPDHEYHAEAIRDPLKGICTEILSEKGCGREVYDRIRKVPQDVYEAMEKSGEAYVGCMRLIARIQDMVDDNRRALASSGALILIVEQLIGVYREVFSDMAANAILACSREEFHEAFCVSEGMSEAYVSKTVQQRIRESVVEKVVFRRGQSGQAGEKESGGKKIPYGGFSKELYIENFENYVWIREHLEQYAEECYEKLRKHLQWGESRKKVARVREIYAMFTSGSYSCDRIYREMNACIAAYLDGVQRDYEADLRPAEGLS